LVAAAAHRSMDLTSTMRGGGGEPRSLPPMTGEEV
jgi:hypothetical protein